MVIIYPGVNIKMEFCEITHFQVSKYFQRAQESTPRVAWAPCNTRRFVSGTRVRGHRAALTTALLASCAGVTSLSNLLVSSLPSPPHTCNKITLMKVKYSNQDTTSLQRTCQKVPFQTVDAVDVTIWEAVL